MTVDRLPVPNESRKIRLAPGALMPVGGADEGVDGTERLPDLVTMPLAEAERFVAAGWATWADVPVEEI